jgi:hypothetical protein
MEGARYRDELLTLHRKAGKPDLTLDAIHWTLINSFLGLIQHLPSLAFQENDDAPSTVPLFETVDVGKAIADMTLPFLGEGPKLFGLFAVLRDQLARNQLEASNNNPKKLVSPSDYDGTPREKIHVYLKQTPLEDIFNAQIPFDIPDETRFSGHWIIAPPGCGKTTLLHAMFLDDLKRDASIIVMDSKGDLIGPIKQLAAIKDRVVLIEPDPDYPLALNPLDIPKSNVVHTVSLLEYVFSALLEAKMTPLQMTLFRSVLPAIVHCVPDPTLETFRDIITNGIGKYQNYIGHLPDDQRDFFLDKETGFLSETYDDTRKQLIWRLQFLMTNPVIKQMFSALKTKLDIGTEMDAGKIILINNSKAILGDEGAEFFGRFFIAFILAAAQQRAGRRPQDKLPCYVYIDECQNVVRRDEKIPTILDECRSQKIGLILAHQRTKQLEEKVLDAVANCAIRYANSDDEAKYLADKLRATPEFLRSLPRGTFAAFVRDLTPTALALKIPYTDMDKLPKMTPAEQQAIRDSMRARYSIDGRQRPPATSPPTVPPASERPRHRPAGDTPPPHDPGEPASEW